MTTRPEAGTGESPHRVTSGNVLFRRDRGIRTFVMEPFLRMVVDGTQLRWDL